MIVTAIEIYINHWLYKNTLFNHMHLKCNLIFRGNKLLSNIKILTYSGILSFIFWIKAI